MQTFIDIMMYSAMMLGGVGLVATAYVLVGVWLSDHTYDPDAHH